ncbi:MAG TPA: hypothetical protein PKD00_00420 [Burkholderiales bacterium]|nr:hypothetical protein [Burkholderiales bacterium]
MACCGNECLELINAECIEYTGVTQCIPNTSDSPKVADKIKDIEAFLCSLPTVSNTVNVNLQCLGGNCAENIPFSYTYIKATGSPTLGNAIISISIPSLDVGTYLAQVKVYSGTTLITSAPTITNPIPIPLSYINSTGVLVVIEMVSATNVIYSGSVFITPTMTTTLIPVTGNNLVCQSTTVVTIAYEAVIQQIISEICAIKNLITG